MSHTIWLMESLSSQRNIILGIKAFFNNTNKTVTIIASHRHCRSEILSLADIALIEPTEDAQRLDFISVIALQYNEQALHAGRNYLWFETHRQKIESFGIFLTTGTTSIEMFALADNKVEFAQTMKAHGLPVVPSFCIENAEDIRLHLIRNNQLGSHKKSLCIKPVTGIYGMGFWRFDEKATPMAAFNHPDNRKVHPEMYLYALEQQQNFNPLVLIPYMPGPEYSVDMLVEKGNVIAAVARRKEGVLQYLEQSVAALELSKLCAQVMQADGLVNVQTRNNDQGEPVLLEINLRPSGGIGYTRHCGVNLPALFALRQLGLMKAPLVQLLAIKTFTPTVVRSMADVIRYNPILNNLSVTEGIV